MAANQPVHETGGGQDLPPTGYLARLSRATVLDSIPRELLLLSSDSRPLPADEVFDALIAPELTEPDLTHTLTSAVHRMVPPPPAD